MGIYHAYPDAGYEVGPAAIGLCWSSDLFYHFYCAVAPARERRLGEIEHGEVRGIAVATSGSPNG